MTGELGEEVLEVGDPMQADDDFEEWNARRAAVASGFKPKVPVSSRDLLAGRLDQMNTLIEVAFQSGDHAAIFGEGGVGKTSLAGVMQSVLASDHHAIKINCNAGDTYGPIWHRVFGALSMMGDKEFGFNRTEVIDPLPLSDLLGEPGSTGPDEVRTALDLLSRSKPVVVFLDEFDRITDPKCTAMMADTLKVLSDNDVQATIVIVGVADDISDLIDEHRSAERGLTQIPMPRMRPEELRQIIHRGLDGADMTITEAGERQVLALSQGLPHYTHLVTQNAGFIAIDRRSTEIGSEDVRDAIAQAIDRAQQAVRDAYQHATSSNRKDSLYRQVLLACALATTDQMGFFAPSDVRAPLSEILGKDVQHGLFAQHLKAFSDDPKRAPILQKRGKSHRFRYRFINPLIQPYVVMKGLQDGMLPENDAATIY